MAQTPAGAIKVAAQKRGLTEREYRRRVAAGLKWCRGCGRWQKRAKFGRDATRHDGLASLCLKAKAEEHRRLYVPRPRPKPGRRFVPARPGDKLQARARANHLVNVGLLPPPNEIACCDCGHLGDDRRHEYDHYLGYAAEHQEHVEAVCTKCHARRARERGEFKPRGKAKR